MNPYAIPSLLSAVGCVALAAFLKTRASRTLATKLLCVTLVLFAAEALIEFAYRVSDNRSFAQLCWKLYGHWPFIIAVLLHFVLVFTKHHAWLKRPLAVIGIYLPAAVFAGLDWGAHLNAGAEVRPLAGWTYGPSTIKGVRTVAYLWVLVVVVTSTALVTLARRRATHSCARQRYGWASVGMYLGLAAVLVDITIALLQLRVPALTVPVYALGVLAITYDVVRSEMAELTPAEGAASIIATMRDALFLLGTNGRVTYTNGAARRLVGRKTSDLIGHPLSRLFDVAPDWVNQACRGELSPHALLSDTVTTVLRNDGGRTELLLTGTVVLSPRGKLRGIVVIGRDISEQRRVNRELEEYKEHLEEQVRKRTEEIFATNRRLQQEIDERRYIENQALALEAQLLHAQKLDAVGRLAGGIAHDFNNLLTGIMGFAEQLYANLPDGDTRQDDVSEILLAAHRASELVQQLLAFGRKQPIERRIVDLDETVTSLHKMLSRIIGDNVHLRFTASLGLHWVDIDPGQFQQILVNLVVNARDAMPDGGIVELTTDNAYLNDDFCRGHEEITKGRYVRVTVRDTGIGMSPEVLTKAFEPFYTTKAPGKGSGLGLSTVYGLVQQNRGCIDVQSEVGVGTTFQMYFPRVIGKPSSACLMPAVPLRGGNETVLVVDDEPALTRLASRVLGRQGYKVFTAPNAAQALDLLERIGFSIQLLLTDVIMPGASGRELAETVRKRCPSTAILFMTGFSEQMTGEKAFVRDGARLLNKPFSADTLLEEVRTTLDNSPTARHSGMRLVDITPEHATAPGVSSTRATTGEPMSDYKTVREC